MRKNVMATGLALALSLTGAAVASAQQGQQPDTTRAAHRHGPPAERGHAHGVRRGMHARMGEHRGPMGYLLRGITLTDAQKQQVQQLRSQNENAHGQMGDRMRPAMDSARAARQRGDTAAARRIVESTHAQMVAEQDQHIAALRNILTPEQRTKFDANVTEWKQRQAQHMQRMERGPRDADDRGPGRGHRGPPSQGGKGSRR